MLRKIRIPLAIVFFTGVTLLFLDFTGTLHAWLGWMAKVQLLPAVLALNAAVVIGLVALTLVFGRIYCSVVCPLGVMQDIIAHMGRHGKKLPYTYSKAKNWLRGAMLAVMAAAIVLGIGSIAALLAPYSTYGRIAQNLLQPLWLWGNNALAALAAHMDSYAFYSADVWMRSLPTFLIAVASFALIAVLAWRGGRTWCNTVCPVGTVLGFLSRFSWFKVYLDGRRCVSCSLCSRHCKASCIDFRHLKVDYSRCVDCGNCLSQCTHGALFYGHPSKEVKEANRQAVARRAGKEQARQARKAQAAAGKPSTVPDTSRRHFLLAAAMATTAAAKAQTGKKLDGGLAVIEDKQPYERETPVTPPGSISADNMARHCTGCQLCVAECPNGVLRPSTHLLTLMQPTMSYERGFCRPECTRCSEVCPAGAIHRIDKATKSSTQIGHAVWIKRNCVPVVEAKTGITCGNCARHCPTRAIEMVDYETPDGTVQVPAVDFMRCIGCGACEYVCPARPFSAIHVEGHEAHRTI